MIPYFVVPPLQLGPIALQPFGILSASGILLASWLLVREARRRGLDPAPLEKLATWAVLGGVVGAHLVHLLLYHPEELCQNGPLQLLKIWDGLSSTGGILGGIIACIAFLQAARDPSISCECATCPTPTRALSASRRRSMEPSRFCCGESGSWQFCAVNRQPWKGDCNEGDQSLHPALESESGGERAE